MRIHLEEPPGDILVFLTGQEEIEHACDRLFEAAENVDYSHDIYYNEVEAMMILPLYGSMVTGVDEVIIFIIENEIVLMRPSVNRFESSDSRFKSTLQPLTDCLSLLS